MIGETRARALAHPAARSCSKNACGAPIGGNGQDRVRPPGLQEAAASRRRACSRSPSAKRHCADAIAHARSGRGRGATSAARSARRALPRDDHQRRARPARRAAREAGRPAARAGRSRHCSADTSTQSAIRAMRRCWNRRRGSRQSAPAAHAPLDAPRRDRRPRSTGTSGFSARARAVHRRRNRACTIAGAAPRRSESRGSPRGEGRLARSADGDIADGQRRAAPRVTGCAPAAQRDRSSDRSRVEPRRRRERPRAPATQALRRHTRRARGALMRSVSADAAFRSASSSGACSAASRGDVGRDRGRLAVAHVDARERLRDHESVPALQAPRATSRCARTGNDGRATALRGDRRARREHVRGTARSVRRHRRVMTRTRSRG